MAGPKDLLPWIYQQGNATRNRLKQLLTDPRAFAGQLEQDAATVMDDSKADTYLAMAMKDPKFAARVYPTEAKSDPSLMQGRALAHQNRLAEAVMGGMTVYHGSPHKFDKFDMSKIGTGEGAQAYGHGLYFAENPKVAEQYAKELSQVLKVDGKTVLDRNKLYPTGKDVIDTDLVAKGGNLKATEQYILKNLQHDRAAFKTQGIDPHTDPRIKSVLKDQQKDLAILRSIRGKVENTTAGNTYKVDLPDEHIAKMLDWDKPLSQQSPEVQRALADAWLAHPDAHANMTGQQIYNEAMKALGGAKIGSAAAAERLRKAGIPGLRYLDGGSRTTGKGTSNFVVFDDQLPKIIERK